MWNSSAYYKFARNIGTNVPIDVSIEQVGRRQSARTTRWWKRRIDWRSALMQINGPRWQSGHIEIAKYIELRSRKNFKSDRRRRIAGELIQSSLPLAILSLTREKNSRSPQSSYCFLSWDLRICIKIATCKEDKGKLKSNPLESSTCAFRVGWYPTLWFEPQV